MLHHIARLDMEYFLEDSDLYTLWVYTETKFHPDEYFGLKAIAPKKYPSASTVFTFLEEQLKAARVPFNTFHRYYGLEYKKMGIPPTKKDLEGYSATEKKKIHTACTKFKADDFGVKEIQVLDSIIDGIHDSLYLQPRYEKKELLKLQEHIDAYIDKFLNNELFVYDRNYFNFEKQKQCFIEKIKKMQALESYGKNFIVSETISEDRESHPESGFLFIHTLLALQKLGYIEVLRLWHSTGGLLEECTYHASIVVTKSFIDEVNNSYRKDNPSNIIQEFDEKLGILKFAGCEIELSKKGKETDAVLLLKSLLKVEGDDWSHNDEILADWGYNDDDRKELPKNKVYFAGQKINTAVALKTQINDFLECGTTKVRINPKYRKVDG